MGSGCVTCPQLNSLASQSARSPYFALLRAPAHCASNNRGGDLRQARLFCLCLGAFQTKLSHSVAPVGQLGPSFFSGKASRRRRRIPLSVRSMDVQRCKSTLGVGACVERSRCTEIAAMQGPRTALHCTILFFVRNTSPSRPMGSVRRFWHCR